MTVQKFDYGEFSIVDNALSSTDTTFTVAATKANRKGQDSGGNAQYYEFPDTTITNFRLEVEEKGGAKKETVGIASIADASNDLSDGRKRYTLTVRYYSDASTLMRGVKQNNDGTNGIANQDTDLIVDNFPVGSKVKMVWDCGELTRYENLFNVGSFDVSGTLGETIAELKVVAIDSTDGKLYKYDSTDSNHTRVGILKSGEGGVLNDEKTYTRWGGAVSGFSGLTAGVRQYASTSTAGDITETANQYVIGNSNAAGTIIYTFTTEQQNEFADSLFEIQDETDTTKKVKFSIGGNTTSAETTFTTTGASSQAITFQDGDHTVAKLTDIPDFTVSSIPNLVSGGVAIGDFVFIDTPATFAESVSNLEFGRIAANRVKIAIPVIGSGASGGTIKIALKKVASPTDNVTIRIETDSAGEPSGTLADANATGDVAGTGLTTSFVDTTVTFSGSITLAANTKYWIVCTRSGASDDTNYYRLGYKGTDISSFSMYKNTGAWAADVQSRPYFDCDALLSAVLTKTDADSEYSSEFFGYAKAAATEAANTTVQDGGIVGGLTGIVVGTYYYISSTAGEASTIANNLGAYVGVGVSTTEIAVNVGKYSKYRSAGGTFTEASGTVTHSLGKRPKKISIFPNGALVQHDSTGTIGAAALFVWTVEDGALGTVTNFVESGGQLDTKTSIGIASATVTNTQFIVTGATTAGTYYYSVEG